ncbi:MAG: type IV secretion system DNA-binding domain-containing protein [Candidatus Bathyarchaeota archaeon]|nr:type IV secretion system DNA-binding domain-containing protein [Candidatus Bathyarchaeota archaeon]
MKAPPERLGSFYLGAEYDLKLNEILKNQINYDARDLTTHAVCVGMTGSGKTGLCVGLLEEAALDSVPAILIDPKGDITNMLLQFPKLKPEDFLPWINPDDARRKNKTKEQYSEYIANLWQNGLKKWGIEPKRIQALKESADFTIYTPGSNSGIPISILGSLAAPVLDFDDHAEIVRERINGTVAALMELAGIDADPVRSREAILLSNIFEHFWRKNEDLDLTKLIMSIQNPPVRQLGVFDVDTFYPEKDRFELAMAFNNLVASSSFQSWLQGDPLNVENLLYTEEGKPRHSIFYIAHLSDRERMFFVTLLLENMVTWIRKQSGTTSLRALLYFDEVFGFFPPVAEPPSKRPLLTLIKQARAFGLGVILVTQNPVDIDYKGLTNAGTWFIGKLQTERDKDRVLNGLKGAISEAGGSRKKVDYDTLISKLKSRVFLMHNVHEDKPVTFHTRWVMCYLRGPLTRPQVKKLMKGKKEIISRIEEKYVKTPTITSKVQKSEIALQESGILTIPPALEPSITQVYVPIKFNEKEAINQLSQQLGRSLATKNMRLIYQPAILGNAAIRFLDRKRNIDEKIEKIAFAYVDDNISALDWDNSESLLMDINDLLRNPQEIEKKYGPFYLPVPENANSAKEIENMGKELVNWLYSSSSLELRIHPDLKIFQRPGESEREFTIRLQQAAREHRDAEVDNLEKKYEKQLDKLEDKLRKLDRELSTREADYEGRKREELLGTGGTVLGYFLGKRSTSSLGTIARRRRMTSKAKMKVEETKEEISELKEDMVNIEIELKEATEEITHKWMEFSDDIIKEKLKPRRTDVDLQLVALAWLPFWNMDYKDRKITKSIEVPAYSK